jgi:hypothetical protein
MIQPSEIERVDKRASKPNRRKRHQPDAAFDSLVPDAIARAELGGVSKMTWWRWDRDPDLAVQGFPPAIRIRERVYRSRLALDDFKQRLLQQAVKDRSRLLKRGPKPQKDGARS